MVESPFLSLWCSHDLRLYRLAKNKTHWQADSETSRTPFRVWTMVPCIRRVNGLSDLLIVIVPTGAQRSPPTEFSTCTGTAAVLDFIDLYDSASTDEINPRAAINFSMEREFQGIKEEFINRGYFLKHVAELVHKRTLAHESHWDRISITDMSNWTRPKIIFLEAMPLPVMHSTKRGFGMLSGDSTDYRGSVVFVNFLKKETGVMSASRHEDQHLMSSECLERVYRPMIRVLPDAVLKEKECYDPLFHVSEVHREVDASGK
ncbi:hypothetical protein VTL71DRAFT_13883 [Oculimacula yallundae]|uniref:Uncharacterized protein n=1 Tax=Oculimacula yallundae TaxID=86028 RepID=A0ABR4CM90_9HELO